MAARKAYVNNIVKSDVIKASLRQYSPSMIPTSKYSLLTFFILLFFNQSMNKFINLIIFILDLVPEQQLVHINATELVTPTKPIKSNRQVDIRKCFQPQQSPFLTAEQLNEVRRESNLMYRKCAIPCLEKCQPLLFDMFIPV